MHSLHHRPCRLEPTLTKSPPNPTQRRPTSKKFSPRKPASTSSPTPFSPCTVAFDQLLSVFLHHPKQTPDDIANTHLPFKFSDGFGSASGCIGTLFTIFGIIDG